VNSAAKNCYLLGVSLLFLIQIGATLLNQNAWPISSFNVFSSTPKDIWVLKAVLIDGQGEETAVDPGQTLPVEFFKARSIYQRVFLSQTPQLEKDRFVARLLKRLQEQPWVGFDETMAPAEFAMPARLSVEAWQLNPAKLDTETGFEITRRVVIYGPSSPTL
jgi:hypothetical protein